IDAVLLPHGADLARVMHGKLLGNDVDLLQIGIDAYELGDPVAGAGGRQVDHTAIETVPGLKAFEDVVENRNIADRRLQYLAPAPGRSTEYDVATRISVSDGRNLTRFAAQYVQDAHAVFPRRDLGEGACAHVVLELTDTSLVHAGLLYPGIFRVAAICARPVSFI